MTPYDYLQTHFDRSLAELVAFVSIPSISTDPAYRADVERAAQWVADRLNRAGPFNARLAPTRGHPVVYGEWLGRPGAPTVLVYGHYDVQPPDPLDKWASAPFEPQVRDGRLYGRGVSDDKGPMLIPILAAEAFFATQGGLPVNLKFLIEGEEEIGSPSLETFIADHIDLLRADWTLSADGAMWRADVPSITVASRGLVALEVSVQGASRDLHSGRFGGSVANALHALAELVASLHTPDGRVAVAGFYDQVEALSAEERAALTALPFDETAFVRQVGVPEPFGEPGYSTYERQWTRPTLEVNGMWGGYTGPGSKTVTPCEAHAKISCRLVPHQEPQNILEKVVAHLERHAPTGVRVTVTTSDHAARPYRIPADHPGLLAARRVLADVYGQEPLIVRMGGTLPVSEQIKRLLGIDTVFFSFSTADEDFHAPNEFFRVDRFRDGLYAWAMVWERVEG